ncbi:MAG: hypothetical protein R3B72_46455 [Polyangiaceae bacterium]
MKRTLSILGLTTSLLLGGCVGSDPGQDEANAIGFEDLYRDGRNLDLEDLLSLTASFATDEVNDALAVTDYASIRLTPTELYATSEDAAGDLTLEDLDALVSGLAYRFGDRSLTTEVNVVRRNHLLSSAARVYSESAFQVSAGLHDFGHTTDGLGDASVRLGFDAHVDLEARVIAAHDSEKDGLIDAPVAAVKAARGFVLPRSVEDLRALAPGESHALRGQGRLGFNLGVGVPILISAVNAASYNLVVSAGLRAMVEGRVDLQVVRLDGERLVVDVGIDGVKSRSASLALHDGWGVHGLVELEVAGLDLGRLVDRALQKQLDKKVALVDASVSQTKVQSRISVSRFRFDLAQAGAGSDVEKAIAQLLEGDMRLAQALANRSEPGVVAEFELSRSGVSSAGYAGIDLLGMRFFRQVNEQQGTVVVQTPAGAQAINFDSLHKEWGSFFSSHGYTRVGLSGLSFDPHEAGPRGEANLVFQVLESADLMKRDRMLDHLDAVIVGIGGPEAFTAIEAVGNGLQRYVAQSCPNSQFGDPCREAILQDPKVVADRQKGLADLEAKLGHLDAEQKALVMEAGELRLTAQATVEPGAAMAGPPTSVVVDYRLDDTALDTIFLDKTKNDLDVAMRLLIATMHVDRGETLEEIGADAYAITQQTAGLRSTVTESFAAHQARYAAIAEAEGRVLDKHPELGELGTAAIEVRFPVDHAGNVKYEEAVAGSLPAARAKVVMSFIDGFIAAADQAKGLDEAEQIAAYTLLGMTPGDQIDLRLDIDMDLSNNWAQHYDHYVAAGYEDLDVHARGAAVSPIDGALFDIDQLLKID